MGRKPSVNFQLPARTRARKRGKKIYYYYDAGGKPRKEIPLGSDYAMAIKKWAELEMNVKPRHQEIITFRYVAERYLKEVIPTKAPRTQKDNAIEMSWLLRFFDNPPAPLEQIEPIHVRQYLDQRTAKTRANREKALFSHVWNKAREWGYTSLPNPCLGIRGNKETGRREVYIEDDIYNVVFAAASVPLREAMELAYLTGQRPSDVLGMSEADLTDGMLNIKQRKTGKKLRISIEGDLLALIDRIKARKAQYTIRSLNLIVDENGQRFTAFMLRSHFDKAREKAGISKEKFQFRDLRAKAGTDKAESHDIFQAQKQLGHSNVTTTHHYVRSRKGEKVKPTK